MLYRITIKVPYTINYNDSNYKTFTLIYYLLFNYLTSAFTILVLPIRKPQ